VRNLEKLTEEESAEMFALTAETVRILKKVVRPHSLNIGMNLGSSSGAGIPDHMHMHIVPRWTGDTSFMMVIGQTKIVSVPLDPIFHAIKKEFDKR
jgi:ATP adenylyltransferase